MNKKDQINKLVDTAINSINNIERAGPLPFLSTRVKTRLNKATDNIWDKAGWFIGRPAIAIPGLIMLIFINVLVVLFNPADSFTATIEQNSQAAADEFTFATANIYDLENTEP